MKSIVKMMAVIAALLVPVALMSKLISRVNPLSSDLELKFGKDGRLLTVDD